jgi:serine protease Do
MRKTGLALFVGVACFLGVVLALQVDRGLQRWTTRQEPVIALPSNLEVVPASFESQTIAAPSDFRTAARKVIPSVVSVDRYQRIRRMFDAESSTAETGSGSGVIISANGTIVTNNHVVAGADEVRVRLTDKRTFTAQVIGTDPRSDLAVIKIDAPNLVPIEVGDNNRLEVGEWVIAVGNPLGYDSTVSVGVVSSLNRSLGIRGSFLIDAIQTDAAINPGNSGGALVNARGQLVGINSAIASPSGGSVGIGFAIPVSLMRQVVDDILKHGRALYGNLGIMFDPRLDGALAMASMRQRFAQMTESDNVPSHGVVVSNVQPGSPAERAGIRELSVILELDGRRVTDAVSLNQVLIRKRPGDRTTVRFWDRGSIKNATVNLVESSRME